MSKKGKQKLVLAKDPKQLALAVFVMLLFFGNSIYMVIKYYLDQNTVNTSSTQQVDNAAGPGATPGAPTSPTAAPGEATPTAAGPQDADIYNQTLKEQGAPVGKNPSMGMSPSQDDNIEIMSRTPISKKRGKLVLITVGGSGRSNPFLPAGENYVPSKVPSLNLPAPPETIPTNTDASKVMTTTISGILYDKYSPSAIINIEGADYLVKRGDIINHYRILSISPTQVIVQLGKNIYQAGVGELLSLTDLNQNTIANLNKKFGGNHHDVSIRVRKKG